MHTYLLSDEDIRRYGLDLIGRLQSLGDKFPLRWYSLGRSGDKLTKLLLGLLPPDIAGSIRLTRIAFDRKTKSVLARNGDSLAPEGAGTSLLIDSAVHSGGSMIAVVDELYKAGVSDLLCYTLVLKKSSTFIPNFYAMLIAEHDRALFQLDKLPNNRLQHKPPFGTVRAVRDQDVELQPDHLDCGVGSLDKISFADLVYGVRAQGSHAYIFEIGGRPVGFIQFSAEDGGVLRIDAIANDKNYRGKGIGSALIRWAETYARSSKCRAIDLWAIKERIGFYNGAGFEAVPGEEWNLGHGEIYVKMRRKILYNLKTATLFE